MTLKFLPLENVILLRNYLEVIYSTEYDKKCLQKNILFF